MSSAVSGEGQQRLRCGFVGAGFIADVHARVVSKIAGVKLTSVHDLDGARATALAQRHGIPQVCGSLEELLAHIDVAHILSPPPLHAKLATACLEHGVDVLIEKPIALSTAECRRLAAAARASKARVGVNHNATYSPSFRAMVERARQWRFGELQHVKTVVNIGLRQLSKGEHHHWMFQSPENLLLEQLPHPLSLLIFLLGRVQNVSVLPSGAVTLNTGAILYDTWQISLVCQRGTAQCFISLGRECNDVWLHAIGQDGTAFVDLHRNILRVTEKSRFIEPVDFFLESFRNAGKTVTRATKNLKDYVMGFAGLSSAGDPVFQGMRASIADFYDSLLNNRRIPAGLDEGTAVIEAYEQIVAAAKPVFAEYQHVRTTYV